MPICPDSIGITLILRHCGVYEGPKAQGMGREERQDEDPFCFSPEPQAPGLTPRKSYASFLRISEALHLGVFHQPLTSWFFDNLKTRTH